MLVPRVPAPISDAASINRTSMHAHFHGAQRRYTPDPGPFFPLAKRGDGMARRKVPQRRRPAIAIHRMKVHLTKLAAAVPFAALLLPGCSGVFLEDKVDEGVIEYALSFPEFDPNGTMSSMLPERTTLTFGGGMQTAELSAGMGIFRTAMVTDNTRRAMDYHMSLMGKRIVAHMLPRDLDHFHADAGRPTILYTNDRDTIAGYPCQRAVAVFDRIDQPEIELWYTDRIGMEQPNWFGPFAEVPGVLLRYEMVHYGLRMRLDAISVKPGKVDPATFQVKPDYEPVPPERMHKEMAEVLDTFSM